MATVAIPRELSAYRLGILEWLVTTDHKKIGILYLVTSLSFFLIGGILALFIRSELAQAGEQVVDAERYNQMVSMHGLIMLLFFIIPVLTGGFGNYLVPLMIGARDMAFPRLNALSYWLFLVSGIILLSAFTRDPGFGTGWTLYPPLSGGQYSGFGMDLILVSLIVLGTSSILGAINFITTIVKLRAPGMTMFRLPLFVWAMLVTSTLVLLATPVLASALVMLLFDRNFGASFFSPAQGGNAVLWQHVFWFYSHPAVYIMILPAMGIVSEVLPVFSRKPLFGYPGMVFALAAIGALGFMVWAHHMFTTGAVVSQFFMFTTFLISIPTGVKMFNWAATMWRGSITFTTAMLFAIGFLMLFLLGGLSGMFNAVVPVDYALHDTYWVVAHIHYVLFGGSVFGLFAGIYYWFPKMTGRLLDENLGRLHWALMFIGFNLTFFPMHILGLEGMPRRIADYAPDRGWEGLNMLATAGAFLVAFSVLVFLLNLLYALRSKARAPADPWEASTLEWATSSPPPPHNFDGPLPRIRSERPLFDQRQAAAAAKQ